MNVTVFVGANMGGDQMYLMEVKALGEWIAKKGHRLIYGGGGIGLMGVLADAVMALWNDRENLRSALEKAPAADGTDAILKLIEEIRK